MKDVPGSHLMIQAIQEYEPAVTMSMVVERVALVLELHFDRVVLKDVYHVPWVSLYLTLH